MGFFPCAPRRPTVAFSLRLLEFMALHDLHVAPNVRAWASTLRAFWMRRGHVSNDKVRQILWWEASHLLERSSTSARGWVMRFVGTRFWSI